MSKIDLAGLWQLECDKAGFVPLLAKVPGDNVSALVSAGVIPDPTYRTNELAVRWIKDFQWSWSRKFEVPEDFLSAARIWLNIDSLDTAGKIFINGREVAVSENMFIRLRIEVKEFLKAGLNELTVVIAPMEEYIRKMAECVTVPPPAPPAAGGDQISGMNYIRKVQCHGGWDWGICLPVCGLYGDVCIESSDGPRLEYFYTEQEFYERICRITAVALIDSTVETTAGVDFTFNGEVKKVNAFLGRGKNRITAVFELEDPELWYPAGYGAQPLYELSAACAGMSISRRIGLRKLETLCEKDEYGTSLKIRVNGIDIFAKGANWIPMDYLPSKFTAERYEKILSDAVAANMNILRVWGGGLYENEDFYRICDEKGILVWQDMMFACAIYPATEHFLDLVDKEITHQVRRLRDHACIALWCGDNECASVLQWHGKNDLRKTACYDRVNQTIGKAVKKADESRIFRPSSPCNTPDDFTGTDDQQNGDIHYWAVWHGGQPFADFYNVKPRFCSEFGYQSFPSMNTVRRYTEKCDRNVTSPVMELHQKNVGGNTRIVEMFARYFRYPCGFENFVYLSQVQQAVAIRTAVEYWRTLKPYCMGTIYWQFNDNNPVASWASVDYYGNWKQLHYQAKRFYAPVLATAVPDDEHDSVSFHAVSDIGEKLQGRLEISVLALADGKVLRNKTVPVELAPFAAEKAVSFNKNELLGDLESAFAVYTLVLCGKTQEYRSSGEYFALPWKRYELPDTEISGEISCSGGGKWSLKLASDLPAFFVFAEFRDIRAVFSDNSLTLLPGKCVELLFETDGEYSVDELKEKLSIKDLSSSYREKE